MILIGVTGYKGSGKTEVCRILQDRARFRSFGFADTLRSMALAVNPVISIRDAAGDVVRELFVRNNRRAHDEWRYAELVEILGYERAKHIPDFRHFLQRLGTEGVREHFGANAWVSALALRVDASGADRVCLSDVRFHSEAAWVLERGGILWRVTRPGVGGDDPHPSEADIPSIPTDHDLVNDGTLEALALAVEAALPPSLRPTGD